MSLTLQKAIRKFIRLIHLYNLPDYMDQDFDKEKAYSDFHAYLKTEDKTPSIGEISELTEDILLDLQWLITLTVLRIQDLEKDTVSSFQDVTPPELSGNSGYAQLIRNLKLSVPERLLLITTIAPLVAPEKLTRLLRDERNHVRLLYPEFGGYLDLLHTGFVPTLQTILFLLAGKDKVNAVYYKMAVYTNGKLVREGIIRFIPSSSSEQNELHFSPSLTQEYLHYFQSGSQPRPDYGRAFPATWVTTGLNWGHLVLEDRTLKNIREIMRWVEHGDTLLASSSMFNVSYPCLFYGPPGTGKSLTAKLIGKKYGKDVFRVDLSMIVSKYIGETEKNLAYLFDRAQGKDWILFFDEADALFTKRTAVNSSQDKWANLEVSYLLQRMEEHKGLTILATNLKNNIDTAMTRRFQSIIYFPSPKENERKQLWINLLPSPFTYEASISMEQLSKLEFSGANIANILKDACLCALDHQTKEIHHAWLQESIRKEFIKENRTP